MFPKEYDPLMVMQAIRIARDTRDSERDKVNDGAKVIVTEGRVPLIDGETPMRVRLILDRDTEKVITAAPIVRPGL